jgi:hypothetical protein
MTILGKCAAIWQSLVALGTLARSTGHDHGEVISVEVARDTFVRTRSDRPNRRLQGHWHSTQWMI